MKLKRYLLDTDIFSYLIDGRHPEVRRKAAKAGQIAISVITAAEIEFGARKRGSAKLKALIDLFHEIYPVVEWTAETVPVYAEIRCALEKSGTPIGDLDMLIAATAKQGDYILVTNNTDHFRRVPGLKVENWVKETV